MTRQDAVNWLLSEQGGRLDFDGSYGNQCVDYFNFYYQFLTGESPYANGYGVDYAKDIWGVPDGKFTNIANDPNDYYQIPQPGDILIYNGNWGAGMGHVEMVLWADNDGVTVSAQNTQGQYVSQDYRSWSRITNALIGWKSYNGFYVPVPVVVPAPVEPPAPAPYVPPEPPVIPPAPVEVVVPIPTPEIPTPPAVPVATLPEPPTLNFWQKLWNIIQSLLGTKE